MTFDLRKFEKFCRELTVETKERGLQKLGTQLLGTQKYLMIFGHVLEEHVKVYGAISYTAFLIPGLVMMSLLQNSFANTSSSLIQSKITGNLIFVLLAPLSHLEFFMAYVLAAMVRGLVVGLDVFYQDLRRRR